MSRQLGLLKDFCNFAGMQIAPAKCKSALMAFMHSNLYIVYWRWNGTWGDLVLPVACWRIEEIMEILNGSEPGVLNGNFRGNWRKKLSSATGNKPEKNLCLSGRVRATTIFCLCLYIKWLHAWNRGAQISFMGRLFLPQSWRGDSDIRASGPNGRMAAAWLQHFLVNSK